MSSVDLGPNLDAITCQFSTGGKSQNPVFWTCEMEWLSVQGIIVEIKSNVHEAASAVW